MIDNQAIEVVSHTKILGLTVSDNLQWNNHANKVTKKVNKRLFFSYPIVFSSVIANIDHKLYNHLISRLIDF